MKCLTEGCYNEARKGKHYCHKCTKKKYRDNNPIKAAYQNLRLSARRRNKSFEITLKQFSEFVLTTDYIIKRGKSKTAYHIDRIDETKGYTIDNLQVLTNSENIRKYLRWHWDEEQRKMKYEVETMKETDDNNSPF